MTGDVTRLKARLHSKKFATEYPRHLRDDATLHEVPASDRDILKYVPPVEGHVYGVATPEPRSGYVKAAEIDLEKGSARLQPIARVPNFPAALRSS